MLINDLDLGGRPVHLVSHGGQALASQLIAGSRMVPNTQGADLERIDVDFWVEAWQSLGGAAALSLQALRYLIQQLEEIRANADLQPVYLQPFVTGQPSPIYPSRGDARDGWYYIDALEVDPETYNRKGAAEGRMTATKVAPAAPSPLTAWFSGAALASSYSATATNLISVPINSFSLPPSQSSRTGAEGTINLTTSPVPNPVPFQPGATIGDLFRGGCRVWDTINTGTNPVPVAGGTFVNANWVEVKGTQHDFVGDCVVTNGLVLLLYQSGQAPAPNVYLWNTSLGTPTWQLIGSIQYTDNAGNSSTLRGVNLDKVGLQEVRVRCTVQSANAGNWALLRQKVSAGRYDVYCEFQPLTQSNTGQNALTWNAAAAYATGFTDSTSSTTFPSNLATTTVSGYAAAQGSAASSPIFGFLYQNTPTTAQGRLASTTVFGLGDTGGPAVGAFTLYGFFVVPYSGTVVLATAQATVAPLFQQFKFDRTTRWARG